MKKCSSCKEEKQKSEFYKDKRTSDGLKSQCKKCHCLSTVICRDPNNHSDYNREWMRKSKYHTRDEVRQKQMDRSRVKNLSIEAKARNLANRAVELGFLLRPEICPKCNRSDLKINAHHEDYTKPLDVQWMCSQCHGIKHRNVGVGN